MSIPNSSLDDVQMNSANASLKVVAEGTSTISVVLLAGGFYAGGNTSILHNAGTDKLVWQVTMFSNVETEGNNIPTPYESGDNRALLHSYVDSNYLYVEAAYNSSTGDLTPFTITFYYRVLLP